VAVGIAAAAGIAGTAGEAGIALVVAAMKARTSRVGAVKRHVNYYLMYLDVTPKNHNLGRYQALNRIHVRARARANSQGFNGQNLGVRPVK
jgi:hypothetical protein